ncbi:MAG: hypothetical protein WC802_00860 [Patescibacteria group bacterium]|jgi:hypothetical protein
MNKQDLQQIRGIVTEVVYKAIDERVPLMIDRGINSALENVLMPQFDLIHSRIDKLEVTVDRLEDKVDRIENRADHIDKKIDTQMASKGFVEEQLDKFRMNHGLRYKPAT